MTGAEIDAVTPESETPFRMALLGDFSGRVSRGVCNGEANLASRRMHLIDRDNFDEVLAKCAVETHLPLGEGESLALQFSRLDDFHPDQLFSQGELFRRLREIRTRLQDPATFPTAAEELGLSPGRSAPSQPGFAEDAMASAPRRLASGSLLDEIIEASAAGSSAHPARRPDALHEFVRRVTEPHLVVAAPRQAEVIAVIDRAVSAQMRALLHTPGFQALEAAWRAVFLLVRRIETGARLKLYLFDISKAELAADLSSTSDLRASGIYRLLVEKTVDTAGAEPWAVIAGNYMFGSSRDDAKLLGRMAKIARAAGAPFLGGASSGVLGCPSFESTPNPRDWKLSTDAESVAAWTSLRQLPEAGFVGLILPRFLLRMPYGSKTQRVESFDFEEMPDTPSHEDYLWGNSAFIAALLLAQAFSEAGWALRRGGHSEIDGLPLHVYEHKGEFELKPCAEVLLTEKAAAAIMERGLMPLASLKGRDAVRLLRFQSIAKPPRGLAGRWNA